MSKKLTFQIYGSIALCIVISNGCLCNTATAGGSSGSDNSTTVADSAMSARAPMRLQKDNQIGYSFSIEPHGGFRPASGRLVSINGVPLRGKSDDEISRRLEGAPGTSVDIEYLDTNDTIQKINLQRELIKKGGTPAITDLRMPFNSLDCSSGAPGGRADYWEEQNLDLIARAFSNAAVEEAMNLPGDNAPAVSQKAAEAVVANDMVGDMNAADRYLKLVMQRPVFDIQFGGFSNSTPEKLIADLRRTNRLKEADALCAAWLQQSQRSDTAHGASQFIDRRNSLAISLLYAEVLADEGRRQEGIGIAKSLIDPTSGQPLANMRMPGAERVEDLLERLGDLDRARQCYESSLNACTLNKKPPGKLHLNEVREYCFLAYQLAQIEEKQGQLDKAIETIKQALAVYDSRTRSEDQLNAEQLCIFFPAGSDLYIKLAELNETKGNYDAARDSAQSAVKLIEQALGPTDQALRRPLSVLADSLKALKQQSAAAEITQKLNNCAQQTAHAEHSDAQKFTLLRQALNAKSAVDAKKPIEQLIEIYEQQPAIHDFRRPPINMFCALLELSRSLSDRAFFAESDALLDRIANIAQRKEFTPVALAFIKVEKAVNCERQKSKKSLWSDAMSNLPALGTVDSASPIASDGVKKIAIAAKNEDNFRALAILYAAAQKRARANLLVDHALAERAAIESSPKATVYADQNVLNRSKVILLLDAARIRAQFARLAEAQKLADGVVALCASTLPPSGNNARHFDEQYRYKIVALANAYKKGGLPNRAIEQFLKLVLSKINIGATADVPIDERVSRYYGGYYSLIDACLARLTFEDGNASAAEAYVNKAIEECGNNVPFELWTLGANIAYTNKNFKAAAHRYSEADNAFPSLNISPIYSLTSRPFYLKKAAECASKIPDFDKTELANIYLRLGTALEGRQWIWPEALSAYEKADALIPDTDPGKPRLNQRISNLKVSIAAAANQAAIAKQPNGPAPPAANLTPEEIHIREVASAKSQIDSLKQSAELAEKNNLPTVWKNWMSLAEAEARAEQPTPAIEDAKHALRAYKRIGDTWDFPDPLVSSWFCKSLAKQGHSVQAEELLLDGLQLMQKSFGSGSAAAANQLSQEAMYYLDQDNNMAFKTIDEILNFDPRVLDVRPGPMGSGQGALKDILSCASNMSKQKQAEVGVKILQKVLNAQQKNLAADDRRIADTLTALGEIELSMDRNKDAEKHLLQAAQIYRLYVGYLRLSYSTKGLLTQVWKKMGRKDADEIEVRPIGWVSPALLRAVGDETDAAQIEKTQKLPDGYIDPSYPGENGRQLYDKKAEPAKQIKRLQKEYSDAGVVAPYSIRAVGALSELMRIALAEQAWPILAEASAARIKIYERVPDELAGRWVGCVPPNESRMDFFSRAARSDLHQGKPEEAQKWLDRAIEILPEKSCMEYITIATLELECGKPELASKYAASGDENFTEQYFAVYPHAAASVWNKVGQSARAQADIAKGQQIWENSQKRSNQAQHSPFSRTGI